MTATCDTDAQRLISIGMVGRAVGLRPTRLRELEAAGVIPKAARLEGMDRRLYSAEDVATIRAALANRATGQPARGAA